MKSFVSIVLSICILFSLVFAQTPKAQAEEDMDMLEYAMLDEPTQQELIEDELYNQLYASVNGKYQIDVQTFYESKEALEEELYNSRESEYFGYLLSAVDAEFNGTPYVFTMDEKGNTVVREFEPYDDIWEKTLTNIAIGTGVILVCVTVSSLTVAAAPAVHLVFAVAADYAVKYGVKGALIAGVSSAINRYATTGDVKESLKGAAFDASEGYKWGAVAGSITGAAAKTINLTGLKRATKMSMNAIAEIQMNSNFSDTTIKNISSLKEFKVYQDANLVEYKYGNRTFLIPQDMDWNFVDPATGMTNRQLVDAGYNPVDQFGIKYQLHHVGQKTNSPLALLTNEQHQKNSAILHTKSVSEVRPHGDDRFWKIDKADALKSLSALLGFIL